MNDNDSKFKDLIQVRLPHDFNLVTGNSVFEKMVKYLFDETKKIKKQKLSKIYDKGKSTKKTRKKAVYALYLNGELQKIGKATDSKSGLFHRMSQYYRGKDGKCEEIDSENRDNINVEYLTLDSYEDCWAIERLFQGLAWRMGEKMPWEKKNRTSKSSQKTPQK